MKFFMLLTYITGKDINAVGIILCCCRVPTRGIFSRNDTAASVVVRALERKIDNDLERRKRRKSREKTYLVKSNGNNSISISGIQ